MNSGSEDQQWLNLWIRSFTIRQNLWIRLYISSLEFMNKKSFCQIIYWSMYGELVAYFNYIGKLLFLFLWHCSWTRWVSVLRRGSLHFVDMCAKFIEMKVNVFGQLRLCGIIINVLLFLMIYWKHHTIASFHLLLNPVWLLTYERLNEDK